MPEENATGAYSTVGFRHIEIVILLSPDNSCKEGPFQEGEVLGETGHWLDLGALDLDFTENTI
jgi:hypothetical protein